MNTQPWVIAAALYGMDEEVMKQASMGMWLEFAGIMAYAEAGAAGSGPGAITVESETFG